jgi:hypothetical protein
MMLDGVSGLRCRALRCCVVARWLAAAAFGGRVILSSLLAEFAIFASQGRNNSSTGTKPTRGAARWPVETVAASGGCICSPL